MTRLQECPIITDMQTLPTSSSMPTVSDIPDSVIARAPTIDAPLILTTLSRQTYDHQEKLGMNVSYFRAIYHAGGNLLCIGRPPSDNLDRMLELSSGVLIIGGTDVNPTYYKEENHFARHLDEERDRVEILLAAHAIQY